MKVAAATAAVVTAAVAAEAALSGRPAPDCWAAVGAVAVAGLTDRTGPIVRIVPTGLIPA